MRGNDPRIKAELEWLYGKGGAYDDGEGIHPCLCDYAWTSAGRIQGINMGMAWHRQTTNHRCYHHGIEAQKFYDDNLRRFKKTGNWAEFHINRREWEAAHNDGEA